MRVSILRKPFLDCRPPILPSCRIARRIGRPKLGVRFYFGLHFTVITYHPLRSVCGTVRYGTVYMYCTCARARAYCFALLLYCFFLLLYFIRAEHTISTHKRGILFPLILPGYLLPVRKYESTYLLFPLLFPKVLLFPSCLRRKRLIDLAGPISRLDPRAVYLAPSRAGRPQPMGKSTVSLRFIALRAASAPH